MWFVTNNSDSLSIEWELNNIYKHLGAETAQHGLEIVFKYYKNSTGINNEHKSMPNPLADYTFWVDFSVRFYFAVRTARRVCFSHGVCKFSLYS